MPPRHRIPTTDPLTRLRNEMDALGRPGMAGTSRVGFNRRGRSGVQSVLANVGATEPSSTGGGQLLLLSATGAAIASGGDYVTFDALVHKLGFDDYSVDDQTVRWPLPASGSIQVEFQWDSYEGGGTVEIEVDGVVPDWGMVGSSTVGREGAKRRGVEIPAGSQVRIKVTQTSGSPQTADVTVEFQVQDPYSPNYEPRLLETLWVDSTSATGSTSTLILRTDQTYTAVATGNFRGDSDITGVGTPDALLYPSPSGADPDQANEDAEVRYADNTGTLPTHTGLLEFDLGSGFAHLEPSEGPFSTPQIDHQYTFVLTGAGSTLGAKINDPFPGDNNGLIKLDIYGVA